MPEGGNQRDEVTPFAYSRSRDSGEGAARAGGVAMSDTREKPTAAATGGQDARREQRAATHEGAGGAGEERTPHACRPWMADPRSKRRAMDGAGGTRARQHGSTT